MSDQISQTEAVKPLGPSDAGDIGDGELAVFRSRRRWPWFLVVLVIAAATVGGWWLINRDTADQSTDAAASTLEFAEVVTTDLEAVETIDGTVGFDPGDPIASRLNGTITDAVAAGTVIEEGDVLYEVDDEPVVMLYGNVTAYRDLGLTVETEALQLKAQGTITWLPDDETVLDEGDVIARVDEEPVVLLFGDIPAFRSLNSRSSDGADIEQLEAALVRFGYDPDGLVTVDEDFTSNTTTMVEAWQEAMGATDDGSVDPGDVVWSGGPITIHEVTSDVGDQSPGPIASIQTDVTGPEGADVLALEEALSRLGFGPGSIDGVFDEATEQAVIEWQTASGMEDDGVVDLGEVVFLTDSVRIADRLVDPGDTVHDGSDVLATSTNESVVAVDLPASDQALLEIGDVVTVEMPDHTRVGGVVVDKAAVVTRVQGGEATLAVVVTLDDPSAGLGFDQAPVDVDVVTDSRTDVLAVPVTALLALAEGGYAVEVDAGDGTTDLVAVVPGMYADGLVEVESPGLVEGARVVAP